MSTGPTGPTETQEVVEMTGLMGTQGTQGFQGFQGIQEIQGPTGPDPSILAMFPSAATGPVEPPHIVTMDELMGSYSAIVAKEVADRSTLSILLNETRETLRPQMFTWAGAGFTPAYVIQEFTVSPPSICSDGVARGVYDYVVYLLGKDMGDVIAGIQALCGGVVISYSFLGNTLRIHVSKV